MHPPPTNPHPVTDLDLIQAVQRGELQAFEVLLDRHLDPVHAFISLRLPLAHLTDELTHECFVFAFRHIREFTAGAGFRSWLLAIAANKVREEIERFCREERNRLTYAEYRLVQRSLQECEVRDADQIDALHDCLDEVPTPSRDLLTLRYHEGHSTLEIAQRLDRSHAWVRTTLCRLRQQLRDCVESKLTPGAS